MVLGQFGSAFGRRRLLVPAFAIALMVVSGCAAPSVPVAAAAQQKARKRWTLSANNPVIGISRPPAGLKDSKNRATAIWNDPSVLKEGDGYSMWASLGYGGPKGVAIYKLHSSDGESWTVDNGGQPVLEPGGRKDFDSMGVETPSVIKVGDEYHMYYSAYPHGKLPLVTLGHAVSRDGVHWEKRGELTSLTKRVGDRKGNAWGWLGRGEPAALYRDGMFWLYFTDVKCRTDNCKGSPAALRGISVAVSRDGQTFEQRGTAPVVLQSAEYSPEQGWEGYSTPAVVATGNGIDLFCDVFRTGKKQSIQTTLLHLHSDDGVTFTEVGTNLVKAGQQPWEAISVRSPSVVVSDGVWRMWFAGDNFDPDRNKPHGDHLEAGIGLAIMKP